jgi:hypothetical protein
MASRQECCKEFITAVARNKANHDEETKKLQKARSRSEELTRRLSELRASLLGAESELETSSLNEQVVLLRSEQKALADAIDKGNKYIKNVLEPNGVKLNYLRDECFDKDYNSDHACGDPELAPRCCDGYQSTSTRSEEGISGEERRLRPDSDQTTQVGVKADSSIEPKAGDLGKGIDQKFIDETVVNRPTPNAIQGKDRQIAPKRPTPLVRQKQSYKSVSNTNLGSTIGPASPAANKVANLAKISNTNNVRGSNAPANMFLATLATGSGGGGDDFEEKLKKAFHGE